MSNDSSAENPTASGNSGQTDLDQRFLSFFKNMNSIFDNYVAFNQQIMGQFQEMKCIASGLANDLCDLQTKQKVATVEAGTSIEPGMLKQQVSISVDILNDKSSRKNSIVLCNKF